jgi:hypothetical protein
VLIIRRHTPAAVDSESAAYRKALFKRFGLVVAIKAIAIAAASTWLGAIDHPEFIAPVVA